MALVRARLRCTQAESPGQIKTGSQCLCLVLLFLFPYFSEAVHASETAKLSECLFQHMTRDLGEKSAGDHYFVHLRGPNPKLTLDLSLNVLNPKNKLVVTVKAK